MFVWYTLSAEAHQPHDPTYAVAVSPAYSSDETVFATRFPDQNWRSVELARATDGGTRFEYAFRGLANVDSITDAALSPEFAADGVGLVATEGDGAWVTWDGGETWSATMAGTTLLHAAVAHDGGGPVLFLGESGGPTWRSVDLGATWMAASAPDGAVAMAAFGVDLAVVVGTTVHRSDDAGLTFVADDLGADLFDVSLGPEVAVVGTADGVSVSLAGGPFAPSGGLTGPVPTVGVSPTFDEDGTIFAATRLVGVQVSEDGGATFAHHRTGLFLSDQSSLHFYEFGFSDDYARDGVAFVAMFEGLAQTRDHGRTWVEADTRSPALINAIALSPDYGTDRTLAVVGLDAGVWVSNDSGDSWTISNRDLVLSSIYDVQIVRGADGLPDAVLAQNGAMAWGEPPYDRWSLRALPPGIDYSTRIAPSPDFATDGVAVLGTRYYGLFRTDDHGNTWTQAQSWFSAISSIAWSPDGSVVLAGTNTGRLLRSDDHGASWTTALNLVVAQEPIFVEADDAGFLIGTGSGVYTSVNGRTFTADPVVDEVVHQVATTADGTRFVVVRGGELLRDDGSGWTPIAASLTDLGCPYELAASPDFASDHTVFAALDDRLFRSVDAGDSWTEVGMWRVRYEEDAQALRPHALLLASRSASEGASVTKVARVSPGTRVRLEFHGTGAGFVGPRRTDLGGFDVYVDGALAGSGSARGVFRARVEQFVVDGLPLGVHEIEIRPTTGPILLDAIDVLREPGAPLAFAQDRDLAVREPSARPALREGDLAAPLSDAEVSAPRPMPLELGCGAGGVLALAGVAGLVGRRRR